MVFAAHKLPAPLVEFIQLATEAWLNTTEIVLDPNADIALQHLAAQQTAIGWDLFMRGFLTKEWLTYASSFQIQGQKPYKLEDFFPKLILAIWTTQTNFWK